MSNKTEHKVYLVHGYFGYSSQFKTIRKMLENEGFITETICYKSRKKDINIVAKEIFEKIQNDKSEQISFVTHSMGGLIFRAMYQYFNDKNYIQNIANCVMIAPLNKGVEKANIYEKNWFIKKIFGINLQNITPRKVAELPIPNCRIAIITCLNDNVVSPESTLLGTENEVLKVKCSHIGSLKNREINNFILSFLKN